MEEMEDKISSRKKILTDLTKRKIHIKYGSVFRDSVSESLEMILGISKESLSDQQRKLFDTEVKTFYDYVPSCLSKAKGNKKFMLKRFAKYFDEDFVLDFDFDLEDDPVSNEVRYYFKYNSLQNKRFHMFIYLMIIFKVAPSNDKTLPSDNVELEDVGIGMSVDNGSNSNTGFGRTLCSNISTESLDTCQDTSEITVEELDCGGYKARSTTSQWRDQNKVLGAAKHDPDLVMATAQKVMKSRTTAGSNVVKRIYDDPRLGEPLLKYAKKLEADLEKMDDDLTGWDENGERVTPIKCLAYLLGLFYAMFLINY